MDSVSCYDPLEKVLSYYSIHQNHSLPFPKHILPKFSKFVSKMIFGGLIKNKSILLNKDLLT